ncbi:MAG TPA: FKBP-type peptidyl-prolyl cis-trans isomerase [Steroidobacteraceae bacterium]|jgi:FKBP-type peptidyl-prolyl cis-trans isomerase|nr:FKBP-type peptidyl-prolyl cis-trans isomerase [Steroidobacteraceae bacterium]
MTSRAPHRGRALITVAAAVAALCSASMPAAAQPAPAASATQAPAASKAPAKGGAAPAKNPHPCKETPGSSPTGLLSPECLGAASYSIGVLWGSQLHSAGLPADGVSTARIAQGIRDGLSGKATLGDEDRDNIRALSTSAIEINHHAAEKFLAENGKKPGVVTTASGLEYQELKAGSGDSPKATDSVVVNYRGTLINGTEFDASAKHGGPATFEVNHLIPGWTEALQLMKPGAKWKLYVPPRLAYDVRPPTPVIPPGSALVFEMELLSVKPAAAAPPASANPPPAPVTPAPK